MSDWLTGHVGISILILVIGLALLALGANFLRRKREHEWARAARHLRLKFSHNEDGPLVTGEIQGRPVELKVVSKGSDAGAGVIVARLAVKLNGVPESLVAEASPGLIGDVSQMGEVERILSGDEEFDRNVCVHGGDTQAALAYWTAERRNSFLSLVLKQNYDRLALKRQQLAAEIREAASDHTQIEQIIHQLLKIAPSLDVNFTR